MARYIIVGGVAGGATVAARLRRLDEFSEIVLFERGENISYANCGLPYYIGGKIKERDKLFVQTPESFARRFNIDVRTRNEVIRINRDRKTVTVKNLISGEIYEEHYDRLVLSPGAEPIRPPIDGVNLEGIFTLRNVADTDRIINHIEENKPRRAVIVGAGFIGLEMAENLHRRGILTTLVEMAEQVMTPLDFEMAAMVHQHLKIKNLEFYLKDGVARFTKNGTGIRVKLGSGKEINADLVILSVGVRPETKLAREAGLKIGENGGILVNEFLQTSDENIYAVGDAIEFINPIIGEPHTIYLAGPANRQGRLCADNLVFGNKRKYSGAIGTAIAKVFDITVASTGLSEKVLRKKGIRYISSITHSSNHAGYYPGAVPMSIKINFDPDSGKVYGAQIVGYSGVDKRVDLIAAIIKQGGTIYDLQEIEHAYAPPFSSAKDPVHIAGYVAENISSGLFKIVHWHELRDIDFSETVLIDVRTPQEFEVNSIPGAVNIPLDELRDRLDEIPRNKKIIVYCAAGHRGYLACRILRQRGFENVYNLSGGIKTYELATQKQSNEDIYDEIYVGKDDILYEKVKSEQPHSDFSTAIEVDACGLQCPGPIIKVKEGIETLSDGQVLRIRATDPGFYNDVKAWTEATGNKLLDLKEENGIITAEIQKTNNKTPGKSGPRDDKTIIVFSDDLDRAIASFVIASGAASMGKKVTMFFTFWGLNVIKKRKKPRVKKDLMGKMFDLMLPGSARGLRLSRLNMLGLGSLLMKVRMRSKNIGTLEDMIKTAISNGVELIACQMSMDVMGVKKEELIDGVKVGGVATYLNKAENANLNLFI